MAKYQSFLCNKINQKVNVKYEAVPIGGQSGCMTYKKIICDCKNEQCNDKCSVFNEAPLVIEEG